VALIILIYTFFYAPVANFPVWLLFVLFMTAMAFRNVSYNTLTTKVPGPTERARFQSIQSSIQHGASALGAFVSSLILTSSPALCDGKAIVDAEGKPIGRLEHMPTVAAISIALSAVVPVLLFWVERRVRKSAAAPATQPHVAH
jgi:Na+/melibiose symporter-like transporter